MDRPSDRTPQLLLLVAGAKGAIGTTLAATVAAMQETPQLVLPGLTTADKFPFLGECPSVAMAGWDKSDDDIIGAITRHGVLPEGMWRPHESRLAQMSIFDAPDGALSITAQIKQMQADIRRCCERYPDARPVLVNLLPAACDLSDPARYETVDALITEAGAGILPDLAYVVAAIDAGIPVVNFTPNTVELPAICSLAVAKGVPIAGRDGKTGQTYFKVVLASALKARGLYVDGWYSLNILGNADGLNLMDPDRACGKLNNKTNLLDDILGYPVGKRYGRSAHKVHIDYYPPRGDAKEAWDVIDITGIFGLPMSLRLNLQGRDSILAAPMALDLARWAVALQTAGLAGPVPDLGFYFKKPVGNDAPLTFEDQLVALERLESRIESRIHKRSHGDR
ncbi:MAG: inositol-3-phosphate synthase [Desulfosarcina sp.]|nr:inositol-3-phosphate synthase [Desulfosarcina sp.]MBC2744397.1 inositol-3-phosphate synthase [Desulfosarcina sp.]MBC2767305.1 inositol-3-phosphate synthase [Desulfosarcina sp.]